MPRQPCARCRFENMAREISDARLRVVVEAMFKGRPGRGKEAFIKRFMKDRPSHDIRFCL